MKQNLHLEENSTTTNLVPSKWSKSVAKSAFKGIFTLLLLMLATASWAQNYGSLVLTTTGTSYCPNETIKVQLQGIDNPDDGMPAATSANVTWNVSYVLVKTDAPTGESVIGSVLVPSGTTGNLAEVFVPSANPGTYRVRADIRNNSNGVILDDNGQTSIFTILTPDINTNSVDKTELCVLETITANYSLVCVGSGSIIELILSTDAAGNNDIVSLGSEFIDGTTPATISGVVPATVATGDYYVTVRQIGGAPTATTNSVGPINIYQPELNTENLTATGPFCPGDEVIIQYSERCLGSTDDFDFATSLGAVQVRMSNGSGVFSNVPAEIVATQLITSDLALETSPGFRTITFNIPTTTPAGTNYKFRVETVGSQQFNSTPTSALTGYTVNASLLNTTNITYNGAAITAPLCQGDEITLDYAHSCLVNQPGYPNIQVRMSVPNAPANFGAGSFVLTTVSGGTVGSSGLLDPLGTGSITAELDQPIALNGASYGFRVETTSEYRTGPGTSPGITVFPPKLTTEEIVDVEPDQPFCPGDQMQIRWNAECLGPDQDFSAAGVGTIQVLLRSATKGDIPLTQANGGIINGTENISVPRPTTGSSPVTGLVDIVIPDDIPSSDDYYFVIQTASGFDTDDQDNDDTGIPDVIERRGNDDGPRTITTLTIDDPSDFTAVSPPTVCQGQKINLQFSHGDTYTASNHEIRVVLSDPNGNFNANAKVIGRRLYKPISPAASIPAATAQDIMAVIPFNAPGGSLYKVRLESTQVPVTGCEYGPFIIPEIRNLTGLDDQLAANQCLDASATFSINTPFPGAAYSWSKICPSNTSATSTFVNSKTGLLSATVGDIYVDPGNNNNIYAATGEGLARSTNGGVSFVPYDNKNSGLISDIAVSGTQIFAAEGNKLHVSGSLATNTGFIPYQPSNANIINDIFIEGTNIWLATANGIYFNPIADVATPWDIYSPGNNYSTVLVTGTGNDRVIYAGGPGGLSIARCGSTVFTETYTQQNTTGANAKNGNSGLTGSNINDIHIDPAGNLYLATSAGVAISTDNGYSYQTYANGLNPSAVSSVTTNGGRIYAGVGNGLAMTNIGGERFTVYTAEDGIGFSATTVFRTYANGGTVIVASSGGVSKANLTVMNGLGSGSTYTVNNIDHADAKCRYYVTVSGGGCSAASGMARLAHIPGPIASTVKREISYCEGVDGQIEISGLIPGLSYNLVRFGANNMVGEPKDPMEIKQADDDGKMLIYSLSAGTYNFAIRSLSTPPNPGCLSNVGPDYEEITLNDPLPPSNPETPLASDVTTIEVCQGETVTFNLDPLIFLQPDPNEPPTQDEVYKWYTDVLGTSSANPAESQALGNTTPVPYTVNGIPLSGKILGVAKYDQATQCYSDTVSAQYIINVPPNISVSKVQPATDGGNGTITIGNLSPGDSYTLNYTYTGAGTPTPANGSTQTATVAGTILITGPAGDYEDISVTTTTACTSNSIPNCPLRDPSVLAPVEEPLVLEGTTTVMDMGDEGAYFQSSTGGCAPDALITGSGVAVGRIRNPRLPTEDLDHEVEMRGFIQWDLSALVPANAIIDKVEYRPEAADWEGEWVCGDPLGTPVQSVTGDVQFDVTQVDNDKYAPFALPNFDQAKFDDLGDVKYADFTIAKEAVGAWTDLGQRAVADFQDRMAQGRNFQIGLRLSGNDFDLAQYQFHGIVFEGAGSHKLRITYHLLDYGDLPEPRYITDNSGGINGPSHRIDKVDIDPLPGPGAVNLVTAMWIGANKPDAETNSVENNNATGDDLSMTADIDGIIVGDDEDILYDPTDPNTNFINLATGNYLIAGNTIDVRFPVTFNLPSPSVGNLSIYFDWNNNGVFEGATERYDQDITTLGPSIPVFNINIPADAANADIGVRIRFTSAEIDAYGEAPNGEVEDLFVRVYAFDYGDLPDATLATAAINNATGDYNTTWINTGDRGPRALISDLLSIGNLVDSEGNGFANSPNAFGDDVNGLDDEDGVIPPDTLVRDQPAVFNVFVKNNLPLGTDAYLVGYVDWNDNGVFELGTDEQSSLITIEAGKSGLYEVAFTVPPGPVPLPDRVATRFRLSDDIGIASVPTGPDFSNITNIGEIEDLFVNIVAYDWGDLPEPKFITDSQGGFPGPSHKIVNAPGELAPGVPALYIGDTPPDAEVDGLPNADAGQGPSPGGDDNSTLPDRVDDENLSQDNFEGQFGNSILIAGDDAVTLTVPVTNYLTTSANVLVFIDWNDDGEFDNDTEAYIETVSAGAIDEDVVFDLKIPATTPTTAKLGVRVRVTTAAILDAYGPAPNGEVEDFFIEVTQYDYADLPDANGQSTTVATNNYLTIYDQDEDAGPRHRINPNLKIGLLIDAEKDGIQQANALGDDANGLADEDGIIAPDTIIRGQVAIFNVLVTNNTNAPAHLMGFVDWNDNGDFEDGFSGTKSGPILVAANTVGYVEVPFMVPTTPNPLPERVAARFRLSNENVLVQNSFGPAPADDIFGEVQDLYVPIVGYDWGDLPEPKYITDSKGGQVGPSHKITADGSGDPALYLGPTAPDAELDGQPTANADGDDTPAGVAINDEDLLQSNSWTTSRFTNDALIAGDQVTVTIPVVNNTGNTANVLLFVDWNDDGEFDKDTELYIQPATGSGNVIFNPIIPSTTPTTEKLGVRVRVTTANGIDAYGPAPDGEVEDYFIAVTQYDYADLPDDAASPTLTAMGNYLTTYNEDGSEGPRHRIDQNLRIGNLVDAESDGTPQANAFGDDINGIDDEDGIIPPAVIIRDIPAIFQVFVTNKTGAPAYLQGFVDWDDDGSFEDDVAFTKAPLITIPADSSGYFEVEFMVPTVPIPLPDRVAARFRLSNEDEDVTFSFGPAAEALALADDILGEVQDLYVNIAAYDWGDLPEPLYTTDAQGGQAGPSHKLVSSGNPLDLNEQVLFIGASQPDAEIEGQPNEFAQGDDAILNTGQPNERRDDENLSQTASITSQFTNNALIAGDTLFFTVPVTNNYADDRAATLYTFIDWNDNGEFEIETELYDTTIAGTITSVLYKIVIPETTPTDSIAVRVRLTTQTGMDANGPAPDGEVEDFFIGITQYDYADLPDFLDNGIGNGTDTVMGNYLTIYNQNGLEGPRHRIVQDLRIGNLVDAENDGQPQINSFGDDINGVDDEDGIIPPAVIIRDIPAIFQVFVTNKTGADAYLQGFVDWDDDGSFEDDVAFTKAPLVTIPAGASGYFDVEFMVPTVPIPLPDRVAARFRLSDEATKVTFSYGPSALALADDILGEVQDLYVNIAAYDWGDLPEPMYVTDAQGGQVGPSHKIVSIDEATNIQALYIGSNPLTSPPDAEIEGQPNEFAQGDDAILNTGEPNERRDDEDLSQMGNWTSQFADQSLIAGDSVTFTVPITNNYADGRDVILYTFIDWNDNGEFEIDTELYDTTITNGLGVSSIVYRIKIPETTPTDSIAVRVRLTTQTGMDAFGEAPDGEVEDFFIGVTQYDYADLPDFLDNGIGNGTDTVMGNYLTIYNQNGLEGPRHKIDQDLRIGNFVDAENDGSPQLNAFGDDINGLDDEDLIITPDTILRDVPANFFVFVTNKTGVDAYLQGFVDWDDDGSFEDDVAFTKSGPITIPPNSSGYFKVPFTVPPMPIPLPERVAARFRLSNENQLLQNSFGPALGNDILGEVHDLYVDIAGYDWGDLPEPRYITDRDGGFPGPSHKLVTSGNPDDPKEQLLFIGETQPDAENEGIPTEKADGDDQDMDIVGTDEPLDRVDDEDLSEAFFVIPGTITTYPVTAGEPTDLLIPVTNNSGIEATLWAFIDWNGDGDFDDPEEERFMKVPATHADNDSIRFVYDPVPERNEADTIGVRIRFTTGEIFDPYGPAPDGEVEDFVIELRGVDYGDLPDITLETGMNDFRTLRDQNGPRHSMPVTPLLYLGKLVDSEADGQPTENSDGDDEDMIEDDEDGIIFLTPLAPGNTSQIAFSGTNNTLEDATLYMFADWENDGIMVPVPLTLNTIGAGMTVAGQIAEFDVPLTATFEQGRAYFRFRLTTDPNFVNGTTDPANTAAPGNNADPLNPIQPSDLGFALDGEVEDYYVPVFTMGNLVWEDRNNNGFQDPEEIDLGIEGVRVIVRFGGVDPLDASYDEVNENTIKNPVLPTPEISNVAGDDVADYVLQTFTNENGLYAFNGLIEGRYQVISVDTFNLTPTRPDWIDNVTEEDRDSDGYPLKEPWEYEDFPGDAYTAVDATVHPADPMPFDVRQSKTQLFTLLRDSIGTDEEGILDQQNPKLLDPNQLVGLPDHRVEQRIDFGYTAFEFGDLREDEADPNMGYITSENETIDQATTVAGLFPLDTVLAANLLEGPKHIVTPDVYLGECSDAETEGNPDYDAGAEFAVAQGTVLFPDPKTGDAVPDGLGDDPTLSMWNSTSRNVDPAGTDCGDDENGVHFMTPLIPGYEAIIDLKFFATINDDGPDAFLQAYFDWNGDDDFYVDGDPAKGFDPDEHIVFTHLNGDTLFLEPNTLAVELEMSDYIGNDSIRLMFNVPAGAKMNDGNLLSRFRISKDPNMAATGILPGNLNFKDGIVPQGEVEDYFMKLSKVGNIVWEDRDYDGIQDKDEPVIPGVEITLDFSGWTTDIDGDPFEKQYKTVTDENGKFFFAGLIGNVDPSGIETPTYTLTAADPDNMTPTVNRDTFPTGDLSNCVAYNSDGNDNDIDDRITAIIFKIENPMGLCQGEGVETDGETVGICDMGDMFVMDMDNNPDVVSLADNVWPDCQIDETLDFGFVGFDYGDLPDTSLTAGNEYNYRTLRNWLPGMPNDMGPRHAIQPKLYLGDGVDGELNGQPDLDAGSKAGGDDDFPGNDPIPFIKGLADDDESGIRLLTPLLPGEYAFIRVDYTSQDTTLDAGDADGYVDRDAVLNAFIDWNGDGNFYQADGVTIDTMEAIEFTHESFTGLEDGDVSLIASADPDATDGILPGGENRYKIFGFRVPDLDLEITNFNNGIAFMRYRLSWTGNLDPDNYRYHKSTSPHVILDTEPASAFLPTPPNTVPQQIDALDWTWADTLQTYPQGEVEDFAIPLAKIGNLAWYDHNVNGRQDDPLEELYNTYKDEYGVDTLHLVLIWGGVDNETGDFDAVGYQDANCRSEGDVLDIQYNLSLYPDGIGINGSFTPDSIIRTNSDGLYSFRGLIPGTYNLIPLKYLQPDSSSFVEFWPKHRVLTIKNNVGVNDSLDSDAGPGAVFTIADVNQLKDPEVCVDDLPLEENGQNDALDLTLFPEPFFPDSLYDQTIDFGWVDEPNIEAVLDLVGVDFPTSETCGNFNVIYFLCLKNPTETPLDSIVPFLDIYSAYGPAFVEGSAEISIVEQAFLTPYELNQLGLTEEEKCERQRIGQVGSESALTPYINPNYDGKDNINLLTGGDTELENFYLPGDSTVCIRIEFEINPASYDAVNPWMIQGGAYARAIGFEYDATVEGDWMSVAEPFKGKGLKTRLLDWMPKVDDPNNVGQGLPNPRFGKHIEVYDLSDEYDDPWPALAGEMDGYPTFGDGIRFEGEVSERGDIGGYLTFDDVTDGPMRDKYLDEDDKTIQDDECWLKTRDLSGQDNIFVSLDENCEIKLDPSFFISNHMEECGFDRYPEGSYYRVVVQDKHTEETLWASVDREPFDGSKYLDRKLIYKARSVANSCTIVWGNLTIEDKTAPVVTCPDDINDVMTPMNTEGRYLVCTDIDSVLNNPSSYLDETYAYFTGIATAVDNCTEDVIFDGASDVLEVLADCEVSAANGYAYARIVRTFLFKDRFENKSQCTQTIYFYRPQIVLPDCEVSLYRYDVGADRELTPADLISKYERPEAVPYIVNAAGDKVYLTEESICGFGLNWTNEDVFISDDCTFKIVRKWRILDWCNDGADGYPQYLIDPVLADGCHDDLTWTGNGYEFEQLLVVSDKVTPIVGIPDLDEDGFKGQNGYKGGPQFNPLTTTGTYDAEDIFIFETSGFDCSANFSVTKSMFEVEEDGEWCFDLDVVIRQPILDLDERKTGEYEFVNDPNVEVTGDCEGDYWVSGAEMKFDTTMRYFFQTRFYDECGNDTLLFIPFMVVDRVKPVVICNDELRVTYDNFGTGRLAAVDVDEGTSDNCGKIIWLKVRRPVNDCADGYRTLLSYRDANNNSIVDEFDYIDENDDNIADSLEYFRLNEDGELMSPLLDEVNFFCCDGDSVKVELWASDKVGNVSNCWQYATLENRPPLSVELPGNYILPDSREINCETDEDQVVFLTSGGRYAQGSLSYNAVVSILGGDLFIPLDNTCTSFTREMIITPEIGDCGFGYIDVEWILSNGDDELITESRRITIVGRHNYWIKFPQDARSNCVSPNPDTLEYASQSCDLLAVAVLPEERFETPQDANSCYKIFRTYQVINWCEYDGESNPVVVSRDWDAFNAENCFDTDRIDSDNDADDSIAGEYHLNPLEPDGDGTPGNSDLYVIVDIDNANDGLGTVYYDNTDDPSDGSTDDVDTELLEGYWWAVTREQSACNSSSSAWYDDSDDGNFDNGDFDIDGTDSQDDNDNRYGSFGYWQYTQHIIVYDDIDPELTVVSQDTFYTTSSACEGTVKLEITAEDICDGISTNLVTRVVIDGEDVGVGTGRLSYEGTYSLGTHSLIVTTRDACDNTATFTQEFEVVDGKAPAPIAHEDAVVELGSVEGGGAEGQIWATDLVASPIYDCTGQDASDVDANGNALITKYSINIVGDSVKMDQVGLVFTCDDAQNTVDVELHAWDEAGNHDFVVTRILVQDNSGACDIAAGTGQISGGIATPDDELVNEVEVRLSGADQRAYLTNATGSYVFDELTEGADYTVIPSKDDFHGNGLTTFDVIMLQRHAIGAAVITDPYQLIAADINKSGTITTLDLIQLRKLILGIDERFANNTSWRFIDATYNFRNPANPFGEAFPEVKNINNLEGAEEANFFAVKIGDLNGSASAYVQPRSSERFTVNARSTDRLLDGGKEYQIDFTASGLEGIQGYQFSMQLGAGVELIDMIYGEAQQEHFGVFTDQGVITTSWNGEAGSEAMFSLVLRPEQDIALGDAVQLSNRYTPGEAYKTGSEQIMDVVLKVSASAEGLIGNALYQNRPNPFMGETQIRFELGQATKASLQVRDVTGRLVKLIEGDYEAGLHQVRIKHSELPAAGVYYYTLEAGDFTATKKMILME